MKIGENKIGSGEPVYIIAEIGSNHDGEIEQAKELIAAARDCGADAVKFQSFTAAGLVSPRYENIYNAFKAVEMPPEWLPELSEYARKQEIVFLSTPFDEAHATTLNELGMLAFKVASGDLTHHPLLRHIVRFGKPVILSTGMATLEEVKEAVGVIRYEGNDDIILLHCVSNYPPQMEDINLRAIQTLAREFALPVGFSDHSPGTTAALGAVALGACLIEKHITIDKTLPGPDHPYALETAEFKEMVAQIRLLGKAMGDGIKRPVEAEIPERNWARRGIYAATGIKKGTVIISAMLKIVRPALGTLPPSSLGNIVEKPAKRDITAEEAITKDDYE